MRVTRSQPTTRAELFALLALTCVYLAFIGGHSYSIDGVLIYRQALSIVQHFSLRFAVPVYWGQSWPTSFSGIGLALLYLPSVFVVTKLGAHAPIPTPGPGDWDLFYRDPIYAIAGAPIHIVIAIATGYLILHFVRTLGFGPGTALLALASYGVASPAIVYARGDFPQPALGLWLVCGLLAGEMYRASRRKSALMVASVMLIAAVLTRQLEGSFLLPALVLILVPDFRPLRWQKRVWLDLTVIGVSFAIAAAITLLINRGRYGSFTDTGYQILSWSTPPWIGIPGTLISPSRGILWQFPLILLAPLGVRRLWQTPYRRVAIAMLAIMVFLFLNASLWWVWWGGFSWGSRFFVPAWPLVAIFAAIGAVSWRSSMRIWVTAILFAGGMLWALPGTVTDLLGGYAGAYDGTANSFLLSGYPPIGAWRFVHHIRAVDLTDSSAIDVLWFRLARRTGDISLLVPVILLLSAAGFAWKALGLRFSTQRLPA